MRSWSAGAAMILALGLCGCGDAAGRTQAAEGAASAATSAQAPAAGFVIENSAVLPLRDRASGRDYQVFVKTPPGYDRPENAGRRYPVIYLTDAPYTFQVASGISRVPFSQGRFKEFVIVGISWAAGESGADSRRRDLTPWREPGVRGETGGAPAHLEFLKREVMPLVEGRYRIDAADRTLSGQSYGGLFGLWVVFHEPELFRNYILTSSSIWFADKQILKDEATYAAFHKDLKATIYLTVGSREHPGPSGCQDCERDMVGDQAALAKALAARNYPGLQLRARLVEDGFHETTFPVGLMRGMQWLYLK